MLEITKQQLCSAVSTVIAGYSRRSPVGWHQTLLFESTGDRVIIAAGSQSGFVWCSFPASGETFRVAVNASEVSQVCSACRSETLKISQQGNKLTLDGERGRLSLACHPTMPELSEGWPTLPNVSGGESLFHVNAGQLAYAIKAATPAMDETSEKWSLGGVQIVSDSSGANTYATNGKVAVNVAFASEHTSEQSESMLIPETGVSILAGLLRGLGDQASVAVSRINNSIVFDGGDGVAVITELAGRFPEVGKLLADYAARDKAATMRVDSSELRSALRETIIGYDPGTEHGKSIILVCDGQRVRLLSNVHSDNDIQVCVEPETASGDGGYILVDHQFVSKMCQASAGSIVDMAIIDTPNKTGSVQAILIGNPESGFRSMTMGCMLADANAKRARQAMAAGAEMLAFA